MSNPGLKPPTAKRSPSILVTDVRSNHRSAPFAGASGRRVSTSSTPNRLTSSGRPYMPNSGAPGVLYPGRSGGLSFSHGPSGRVRSPPIANKFGQISIDNILSDVSDIPSAQQRRTSPPAASGSGRGLGRAVSSKGHNTGGSRRPSTGVGRSGPGMRGLPKRITQTIPQRTTKLSEKLVLIPEDITPAFQFEDEEEEDGPPRDGQDEEHESERERRRTYAERLPKERRTDKFPRLTAYCVSDAIRLLATAEFLRENHKILPRIYQEALYAPYYLPLLPGDEDTRVQSSPGGVQAMERMIDHSEQVDHHYEYYSGLETNAESTNSSSGNQGQNNNNSQNQDSDFDPSEPQDFSPPSRSPFLSKNAEPQESTLLHNQSEDVISSSVSIPGFESQEADTEVDVANSEDKNSEIYENPQEEEDGEYPAILLDTTGKITPPLESADTSKHAEIFIFTYGVIVFWNFTEQQEKDILADLNFARTDPSPMSTSTASSSSLIVRPIDEEDIETEELHFTYSKHTVKPRIYNDMITLRSGDHMIKLAMSHAIAQSTKLSRFEARMDGTMHDVRHVPKTLALKGKLGLKREEVLRISGRLFKLRVDVNLSSNILDTPDFFWEDEPSLNPLYTAVREYLEIEQRILVLNERCKVFLDLTEIIADSIAEVNMSRITWIIIILIALSLGVSMVEIVIRFKILKEV